MTGTDALEVVLVATGAVTTAGATGSLVQSWLDRVALIHARRNGIRHVVVMTRIARDMTRLLASSVITAAGIWCLFLPSDMDPVSLILKHALMFVGWILLLAVFSDWQARRRIEDMLDDLERRERA